VLELLAERLSNKEIADRLHISLDTVKMHTRNLSQKLDVHGRRQAVAKAAAQGVIHPRAPGWRVLSIGVPPLYSSRAHRPGLRCDWRR
jgi:hypothetical protein